MRDRRDDRLDRIEQLLAEILERLVHLEEELRRGSTEARIGIELHRVLRVPIQKSLKIASKVIDAVERLNPVARQDLVNRAIIEALAAHGPQTLRSLERSVRALVGTASRSTIKRRLHILEEAGIIVVERRGRRMVIRLAEQGDTREDNTGASNS